MDVDFVGALAATSRVASVCAVLTGMELIADRKAFAPQGPFSTGVIAVIRGVRAGSVVGPTGVVAIAAAQAVAAALLVMLGPLHPVGQFALVAAMVTSIAIRWRRGLGGDGAEQLTIIILVATTVAFVPVISAERALLAAAFIAGQAALAYASAGIAKLSSPVWRSGAALPGILATYSHGHVWAAQVLTAHPTLGTLLSWGVMLFETLFPVLMLGPDPVAAIALVIGAGFHLGCATLMGLNSFSWAFPATYICLWAVRQQFL